MTARILIVEDEWLIAEDYAALLRQCGHEIVGSCATGRACLWLTVDKQQIGARAARHGTAQGKKLCQWPSAWRRRTISLRVHYGTRTT